MTATSASTPNELLLDVMVFPDYHCIEVRDAASWGIVEPPEGQRTDNDFMRHTGIM